VRRYGGLRATHPRHVARHPRHVGPCPGTVSTLEGRVGTHLERATSSMSRVPTHPDPVGPRVGPHATHRSRRSPHRLRAVTRRDRVATCSDDFSRLTHDGVSAHAGATALTPRLGDVLADRLRPRRGSGRPLALVSSHNGRA
jgi:hypothetical protein